MIPKAGGKLRRLGIATARDRVAQAALKLVLEPIFEADFHPCSYGFRPKRRAQDAIAEIHQFTSRSYEWVLEGDIEACFDNIDHTALMDRVRRRVGDKRVLALVKAFLKAGILGEDGFLRNTSTGTPQGGIVSPLLANIALSVLDDHFAEPWQTMGATPYQRWKRSQVGLPNYRLVRYADDFVVLVHGSQDDTEALREDVTRVLVPMGLRLSAAKTRVSHIDEGLDFLGFRIQRRRKPGTTRRVVYTYPSKKALAAVIGRVRALTRRTAHPSLAALLRQLNPVLLGWCTYFRHGVSKATFGYLDEYSWRRVLAWIRRRYSKTKWAVLHRRFYLNWRPTEDEIAVVPAANGDGQPLPLPRYEHPDTMGDDRGMTTHPPASLRGEPGAWRRARRVRWAGRGNAPFHLNGGAPRPDPTRRCDTRPPSPAGRGIGRRRRGSWPPAPGRWRT